MRPLLQYPFKGSGIRFRRWFFLDTPNMDVDAHQSPSLVEMRKSPPPVEIRSSTKKSHNEDRILA